MRFWANVKPVNESSHNENLSGSPDGFIKANASLWIFKASILTIVKHYIRLSFS